MFNELLSTSSRKRGVSGGANTGMLKTLALCLLVGFGSYCKAWRAGKGDTSEMCNGTFWSVAFQNSMAFQSYGCDLRKPGGSVMQNNKHGIGAMLSLTILSPIKVCADTRYEITLTESAAGPFAIQIAVKLK